MNGTAGNPEETAGNPEETAGNPGETAGEPGETVPGGTAGDLGEPASPGARRRSGNSWLGAADLPALAAGATLLGSGGGGDVGVPARLLRHALAAGPVPVTPAAALPEDALVVHVGQVGAPDVLAERLVAAEDFARAVRAVEGAVGRGADAVGVIEIGGLNALVPVLTAAALGLPVVDGDLMGRAMPRVDQLTLAYDGHPACPFAVVGPAGDTVLVPTCAPRAVEPLVRANLATMGGAASLALHPVTAGTLRGSGIPGTLTACLRLGERYLAARSAPPGDFAARIGAQPLCAGRIDEVQPRRGAATGSVTLHDHTSGAVVRVDLLDELLAVTVDGETVAATPEIIVAVDPVGHEPVRTDQLRVGRTVLMLRLPALHHWPPGAAGLVGPAAYGLALAPGAGARASAAHEDRERAEPRRSGGLRESRGLREGRERRGDRGLRGGQELRETQGLRGDEGLRRDEELRGDLELRGDEGLRGGRALQRATELRERGHT